MIKIIKKEKLVEVVTEYDVEPKVVTLYYANKYNKKVIKYKNCVFKKASPIGWGASDANEYRLEYENKECYLHVVKVDITTGKVKDDSEYFFDYEQAVSTYKKLRIELMQTLKDRIENRIKFLEEDRKELEKLENFENKRINKMKEVIKKEDVVVKEIKELKDVVKYEAIDGTIFNYKYECEEYELDYLWHKVSLTKKVIYDNSFEGRSYYLCNNFDELNALFYNVSETSLDEHFGKNHKALENIKSEIFPQYFAIEEYYNAGYAVSYSIKTPEDKIRELEEELEYYIENYNKTIDSLKEIDLVGDIIHLVSDEKKL